MTRRDFDLAAGIVERMDKLEKTIYKLQELTKSRKFSIVADKQRLSENNINSTYIVELEEGELATEVFIQDILEYYINTLNLELDDLRKSFEEI